jgi:hypothetical protein
VGEECEVKFPSPPHCCATGPFLSRERARTLAKRPRPLAGEERGPTLYLQSWDR